MKTIYKIFLLCGLLLCVSSVMNAQRMKKRFTSDIHFGLNLATMDIENANMYKKNRAGVHLGVNFNYKILGNMQLQSGLFITKKGLKQEVKRREKMEVSNTLVANDSIRNLDANYIQIPLAIGYEVYITKDFAFNINVGMYGAYGFKGKYKEETTSWTQEPGSPPTTPTFNEMEKDTYRYDMLKRLDYGAIGSVGLIYDIYTLNFNYEYGLYNVSNDVTRILKNRNMSISLGFRF